MFTPEEYYKAWLMYLGGAVLMMGCWWYLTRVLPWREARNLCRVLVGVVIFMPWYTEAGSDYLAPAIIVAVVESLTQGSNAFWRAGMPLLVVLILSVALSLAWTLWRWRQANKANAISPDV